MKGVYRISGQLCLKLTGSGPGRWCWPLCWPLTPTAFAQAITIDTHGNATQTGAAVDRRYAQIVPTHVPLPPGLLDTRTRLELIRLLQSEQGFAMRPFPKGHKGLTLEANGKLNPAGEPYLNMVTEQGLSAKPGDRLVITDLKFEKDKIIFMLNGGPDAKHRFLTPHPDRCRPGDQPGGAGRRTGPDGRSPDPDLQGSGPAHDRQGSEGAADAAYLVRRQDAHPGIH